MRNMLALALALVSTAALGAPQTRVTFDGHCFTIDGKDTLLYSGAFHYFRCPKELWAERFAAIKAAGFNTIETYAAWNDSERKPPKDLNDFSHVDLTDFDEFLTMASDQFGLNVVVRPGPYICSEWDMGGYPSWLLQKEPAKPTRKPWLRSDDPTYLDWSRHWYKAVDKVIAKHQITKKAPGAKGVILYQIENEYDYAAGSDAVKLGQLHALAEEALKDGIEVPLISCWTHQVRGTSDPILKSVIDCPNFYVRWDVEGTKGSIDAARNQQPGKPVMITELQGGWFSEVGGLLAEDQAGITAAQERNLTLYCLQNGVSALNYYMLFGGTNFGDRTPPNITTSYDYAAPIREDGSTWPKYQQVQAMGEMIAKYGPAIARSVPVAGAASSNNKAVQATVRQAPDGTRFIFVRNASHTTRESAIITLGNETMGSELAPFDSYVFVLKPGDPLSKVELQPRPVLDLRVSNPSTPIPVTQAWVRSDQGEAGGKPAKAGDVVMNGVLDNRYVIYRTTLPPVTSGSKLLLSLSGSQGSVVRLNGQTLKFLGKKRGELVYELPDNTPAKASLEVLYENPGRPNGGEGMEEPHGLVNAAVVQTIAPDKSLDTWKIKKATLEGAQSLVAADVDDSTWANVTLNSGDRQDQLDGYGTVAVFRTTLDLDQKSLDEGLTQLDFPGIDDEGWVYVNGQKVGENHEWNVPVSANVKKYLHAGKNVLAVIVRNFGGQGGLYEIPVLSAPAPEAARTALHWKIADLTGVAHGWEKASNGGAGWTPVTLSTAMIERKIQSGKAFAGAADSKTDALANWFAFSFQKPAFKDTVALRVDALGNGFLWLNGHALGRYWQVGPQREYFLPSSWLVAGENHITLMLKPVDGYATLRGASVAPWGR